jgi:hypothetical protein
LACDTSKNNPMHIEAERRGCCRGAEHRGGARPSKKPASPGNNGIQISRSTPGHDGTMVLDNRIDATNNRLGTVGNAINAFRAGDVIVRGNVIRQCAFSGVRGNAASNIQIVGNTVHRAGECALYSEYAFEGSVIEQNQVDGAEPVCPSPISCRAAGSPLCRAISFAISSRGVPNPPPGELRGIGI